MSVKSDLDPVLRELAEGGGPVLRALVEQSSGALKNAGIDTQTALLVRLAALVALDAGAASYLIHLGVADQAGVRAEAVEATLMELAPLVGTARVMSAAGKINEALRELGNR